MKLNRGFIVFVVLLLALIVVSQFLQPKTFSWNPTFLPNDRQPLGAYVFDSVMRQATGGKYSVERKTFYQLNHDGAKTPRSILVVTDGLEYNTNDIKQIKELLEAGNSIMLVSWNIYANNSKNIGGTNKTADSLFQKTFGVITDYNADEYQILDVKNAMMHNPADSDRYDTLRWTGRKAIYRSEDFIIEKAITHNFYIDFMPGQRKNWETIAESNFIMDRATDSDSPVYDDDVDLRSYESMPIAASRRYGKGELIIVTTPLLFTNYGILNHRSNQYVMRLMTLIADKPIVRMTRYMQTDEQLNASQSPLRELQRHAPLRTALQAALIGILLFFIFTARRRQRAIPTISKPANQNLRFIRMIGTLFYQKHRNGDLIEKRWYLFADDVRRLTGLDVTDIADDKHTFDALSRKTGIERSKIESTIRELRIGAVYEGNISDADMQRLIKAMNDITQRLM